MRGRLKKFQETGSIRSFEYREMNEELEVERKRHNNGLRELHSSGRDIVKIIKRHKGESRVMF